MASRSWEDYPEIARIKERLEGGEPDDLLLLFVPSRTRDEADIPEAVQQVWADQAIALFGLLYKGATGFRHLTGIYQPEGEKPQYDKPILIQSLAARSDVANEAKLIRLAKFCRNMGTRLEQNSVGLVVNDVFINILIPRD